MDKINVCCVTWDEVVKRAPHKLAILVFRDPQHTQNLLVLVPPYGCRYWLTQEAKPHDIGWMGVCDEKGCNCHAHVVRPFPTSPDELKKALADIVKPEYQLEIENWEVLTSRPDQS